MAIVGYARVSSDDQSLDIQIQQLTEAGCEKIFSEKKSGVKLAERSELEACLRWIRDGDVLVVTRLDRFSRSVADFSKMMTDLQSRNIGFKCLLQPFDTTSPQGKLMMTVLAAFAEFETSVRSERQKEGIAKARAAGVYERASYKQSQKWSAVSRMLDSGMTPEEIAPRMKITARTIRRRMPKAKRKNYPENRASPALTLVAHPPSGGEPLEKKAITEGVGGEAKGPFWGRFKKP